MTNEERVQYNKKDNYTYEEVRKMIESALEDRARYLGFFYKVMPRELFDLYAKKALYAYGEHKAASGAERKKRHPDAERAATAIPKAWRNSWYPATGFPTHWRLETASATRRMSTLPYVWRANALWYRAGRIWDLSLKKWNICAISPATGTMDMPTR